MCEQNIIISKVEELIEWTSILDEAEAMVESLKDFIKSEMQERGMEELEAGTHICRFTTVLRNNFDTTAFKREHADMYKAFTKQTTSRRFSIT